MSQFWNAVAAAVVFGVALGGVLAGAEISLARHLAHGHLALAAEVWVDLAGRAGLIAALAGVLGWGVTTALRRPRPAAVWPGLVGVLVATIPVWAWCAMRARDRFVGWSREDVFAGLLAVAVIEGLVHLAVKRGWGGYRVPSSSLRLLAALAILLVMLPAVARGMRLYDVAGLDQRPNLLVIVLDTLRADRMSSYGYPRETTPELDAFALESIRFENFYSTSSWTIPSHASLFTGLYPIRHGATQENLNLDEQAATLAEVLANAGYQTFAASQNPFVSDTVNLAQGFQDFEPLWRQWVEPDGRVHQLEEAPHIANVAFERFLDTSDRERPFFVFINYINAHLPHAPPEPYLSRFLTGDVSVEEALELGRQSWSGYYVGKPVGEYEFSVLSDLYDAEVAHLSRRVAELFEALQRDGRFDDTLIVVTSDHGEHIGDHGHLGHQFTLYNATVRVPLLLRLPGGAQSGRVEDRPGQLVDLFPTLLNQLEIPLPPSPVQGIDLLGEGERTEVFSEYYYPVQALAMYEGSDDEAAEDTLAAHRRSFRAIEADGMRFIWASDGRHELYDTATDPAESSNLYARNPREAEEFAQRLEHIVRAYGDGEAVELETGVAPEFDDQTLEALRALGYVE